MKTNAEVLAQIHRTTRDLVSASELAGYFAVNPRTIWAWVHRGDFPKPKMIGPRVRRWSINELQLWVDAGCPREARGK